MWRRLIYHPEINYALRQTLVLCLPVAVGLIIGQLHLGLLFSLVPACCNIAGLDTPHKRFFKRLIVGGCLLLWIGFQLLSDDEEEEGESKTYGSLMAAVRTILIADLVMSLDNVIAVAAAAQGTVVLLVLGLAISIPLVIFGSTLMIKLMERFPIIVVLGAALIGWVGGETIASDAILHDYAVAHPALHYVAAALGAALVVGVGKFWRKGSNSASAT